MLASEASLTLHYFYCYSGVSIVYHMMQENGEKYQVQEEWHTYTYDRNKGNDLVRKGTRTFINKRYDDILPRNRLQCNIILSAL